MTEIKYHCVTNVHQVSPKQYRDEYFRTALFVVNLHLIFSSLFPRVRRTKLHSKSLNAMPLAVPPQATNISCLVTLSSASSLVPGLKPDSLYI